MVSKALDIEPDVRITNFRILCFSGSKILQMELAGQPPPERGVRYSRGLTVPFLAWRCRARFEATSVGPMNIEYMRWFAVS